MKTLKAAFVSKKPEQLNSVYTSAQIAEIAGITDLLPGICDVEMINSGKLAEVEVIFSTWGIPVFDAQMLDNMPALKAVFYAAGMTDGFAMPLLDRGIKIFSAWSANAIPVAEYCLAQILLSLKGYFRSERNFHSPENYNKKLAGPGIYGETVALIGSGAVSTHLQKLLKPFALNVIVVSSFAHERTISLEEAFATAKVVSNHLPNRPEDAGILNGKLFASMRHGATFINSGRGTQVNEVEMIEVLNKRQDLTAILDVTAPEPPVAGSPLYTMPNVFLTPHIAGSVNDETRRMADYMIAEYRRFAAGEATLFDVKPEFLLSAPIPK